MPPTIVIDLAELRPLGDLIQRRLWFFQGTMAALVAGFLTFEAVSMVLNNYWRWNEYPVDFATSVFMGIMAGIFLLVVSIQVKISSARRQNLDYRVEVGKSALATLVWILIV
ncbi:hypothetical protein B0H63DRAFT_458204 [Podospora didyma]|uniref:Uncharacterized protein n=1 Tax=Podospora didyma TaxID=330526 RepID=A0AAE0U7M0_9PEZI|nr:hypothetical protein B0H63DRAFT_458204 [Podospora didyma]